jgi:hypothetical protein
MWAVSVSGNWRIVFRFDNGKVYDVDLAQLGKEADKIKVRRIA